MMAPRTETIVETLPCGCVVETERHGGKGVVGKCAEAEALFRETKLAGKRSLDPKIKGGAKVKLCREFDRRRAMFREHVGLGAR